jgi:hypothetical protein
VHRNDPSAFGEIMDQELIAYLDESFRSLRDDIDRRFEKVDEEIRHTQVLVEAGRGDIRMVAEGTYGLDERDPIELIKERFGFGKKPE